MTPPQNVTSVIQSIFSALKFSIFNGEMEEAGRKIQAIREALGLSVEEFAAELGSAPLTIQRWEKGQNLPQKAAVEKIRRLIEGQPVDAPSVAWIQLQIRVENPADAMGLLGDIKKLLDEHSARPEVLKIAVD